MATYTIITTRAYEAALQHNHQYYGQGLTKEQYFQQEINTRVLAQMDMQMKANKTMNLTASLETVPEANQDACKAAIEEDIVANGGTIITGPPGPLPTMVIPEAV